MKLDRYTFKAGPDFTTFEFISEGPKGRIRKVVQFQRMNLPNVYNLAFGDLNQLNGKFDDKVVTDNGDSEKVLATVVAAVYSFTGKNFASWVYAKGNTAARTRLYRMGINRYFDMILEDFDIMGEFQQEWELYVKGRDYRAFAVHRKNF